MTTEFPTLGQTSLNYHFGWDSNEIKRSFFLADVTKLPQILRILLGDPYLGTLPHQHPQPYDSFRCMDVDVVPVHPKSTQGSEYDYLNIQGLLDTLEGTAQSRPLGVTVTATYRPWAVEGNNHTIVDESFDFEAQTMSLIGNNRSGQSTNSLHWESSDASGSPLLVTNVQAIVKIIPKIQIVQKRLFLQAEPSINISNLIGCVNATDFAFGQSNNNNQSVWPAETLLFMGMPSTRRFRWDGQFTCEVTLKFAANLYYDYILIGTGGRGLGRVTWNRLFRPNSPGSWWERMFIGAGQAPLYPQKDFSLLNTLGP